ncbi:SIR2 family protein [Bacillus sp. FSL M7-0884]|uniref:SIR2 family protein n=1 Tax=Bacillus TaxID=1386 RepID=UPI0028534CB7|nr:SIR2 family protein [Bacillus wiedmannii]MDR4944169.1 SIR2 family protein [Bacillus wiedmannii]
MSNFRNADIEAILEAIEKKQLIVFIGAGVSANSGLPSWGELVHKFAKNLGINRTLNSEDYLRIPQYFYNERGNLEYYQLIEDVFSEKYIPNMLHDQILSLNPKHIITTNYDDLIEQSLEKHYLFYNKVVEDKDLPYANNNRLYIKMHGDIQKKNIVLKEDDYLNYSRNFRLVENYIESIFINHTVLFIGYSVQDYDLKLIIKRLQSTIGNDFRTAYLLNASSKINDFEKSYFKKFGINIIDISCIPSGHIMKKNLENPFGNNISNLIDYINTYSVEDKDRNSLDYFVEKWKSFKDVHAIRVTDLFQKINLNNIIYEFINQHLRITLNPFSDEHSFIMHFIKEIESIKQDIKKSVFNSQIDNYSYIQEVLSKAGIKKITVIKRGDKLDFEKVEFEVEMDSEEWKPKVVKYVEENNYIKLENVISEIQLSNQNLTYSEHLSLSFAFTQFNQFVSANEQLKNISLKSYKEKKYNMYYLSNFNKLAVIRLLRAPGMILSGSIAEPISEKYIDELKSYSEMRREISESFNQLTSSEKDSFRYLDELLNSRGLIDELRTETRQTSEKIRGNLDVQFILGGRDIDLPKLITAVHEFYRYTTYNLLIANYYSETREIYKNYFDAICCTYLNLEKVNEIRAKDTSIIEPYQFTYQDLIIITNCLSEKEIESIMQSYEINSILLSNSNVLCAQMMLHNLLESYAENTKARNIENKFLATLTLFKYIEFSSEFLETFFNRFNDVILVRPIRDSVYEAFFDFIVLQSKIKGLDPNIFKVLIENFLRKIANAQYNKNGGFEAEVLRKFDFVALLCEVTSINSLKNTKWQLNSVFKEIDYGHLKAYRLELYSMFAGLYQISEETFKKIFKKRIKKYLKENFDIGLFLQAINLNIIVIDKGFLRAFSDALKDITPQDEGRIVNFLIFSKRPPKSIMKRIKKINKIYVFLAEREKYDYKDNVFEIEWLYNLTDEQISEIQGPFYRFIQEKVKEEILNSNLKEKSLIELYFKHFVN